MIEGQHPPVIISGRSGALGWLSALVRQGAARTFLLSSLVGAISGLGAVLFFFLSHQCFEALMVHVAGYEPILPRGESGDFTSTFDYSVGTISPLWCVLLPCMGGLLVGFLVTRFAPEAKGPGTDAAVDAYHQNSGRISPRVIWVKTLASAITLGTGGSGGREGPIAQIGAGFGSWLSTVLRLSTRERRLLLAVGMGAGVAAVFRAPLAGALFAAEILYSDPDFDSEVIMPSLIGCIISYSIFTGFMGQGNLFATDHLPNADHFAFGSGVELAAYGLLALLLTAVAFIYKKVYYGIEGMFERAPLAAPLRPALGGLLTGLVALTFFTAAGDGRALNLLSFGYAAIQEPFDMSVSMLQETVNWGLAGMFMLIALGKILTTSLSVGSGGSAGVFGPSMVIGASVGAALGIVLNGLVPTMAPHPGAFALVGMAGFFAGVARTPISTMLMVCDITGSYRLLVPAMAVCAITFALCRRRITIYRSQVESRRDSPAHRGEFLHDVLEGIRVESMMESLRVPEKVRATTSLRELMELLPQGHSHYYPVVDEEMHLIGIFSLNDIRSYLTEPAVWDLMVAMDIMCSPVIAVTPHDDLATVMRRFTSRNIEEIPVVDSENERHLIGMLRRREVIDAYNARRGLMLADVHALEAD